MQWESNSNYPLQQRETFTKLSCPFSDVSTQWRNLLIDLHLLKQFRNLSFHLFLRFRTNKKRNVISFDTMFVFQNTVASKLNKTQIWKKSKTVLKFKLFWRGRNFVEIEKKKPAKDQGFRTLYIPKYSRYQIHSYFS